MASLFKTVHCLNHVHLCKFSFSILLVIPVLTGCAAAVPSDQLSKSATRYIRVAFRFPNLPTVRAQAAEAAAEVLDAEDTSLMIREGLRDEHPGVRFACCMALGRMKNISSLPDLRKLVHDPDANVRVSAYYALERMGENSYRRAWFNALKEHSNAAVRRNAAMAMGQLGNPAVIPLLNRAVVEDDDEGVRLQAMESMAYLGDRDAIDRFFMYAFGGAGYKQPFSLIALARVAKDTKDTTLRLRIEQALFSQLNNAPYLESRLAAARGLGMLGYSEGYSLALKSLNWNSPKKDLPDDPPENQVMRMRSMAARALGEIGNEAALEPLRKRMETPDDPRVQLEAARAILAILKKSPFDGPT